MIFSLSKTAGSSKRGGAVGGSEGASALTSSGGCASPEGSAPGRKERPQAEQTTGSSRQEASAAKCWPQCEHAKRLSVIGEEQGCRFVAMPVGRRHLSSALESKTPRLPIPAMRVHPASQKREGRAPAPGAVFRALAENTSGGQMCRSLESIAGRSWPRGRVQPRPGRACSPNLGVQVQGPSGDSPVPEPRKAKATPRNQNTADTPKSMSTSPPIAAACAPAKLGSPPPECRPVGRNADSRTEA